MLQPVAKVVETLYTVFWHKWPVHDLVLVIPPPSLIKVASSTRPYSKLGGTALSGREEGGQYNISQTCDKERFEARKVVFSWECLNIFLNGREEGGQYYISQTCDKERFEARKVVFSWECLNIFLNGREEGGQYYISQTCDKERFEARKVVFWWECLNIFASGCSCSLPEWQAVKMTFFAPCTGWHYQPILCRHNIIRPSPPRDTQDI